MYAKDKGILAGAITVVEELRKKALTSNVRVEQVNLRLADGSPMVFEWNEEADSGTKDGAGEPILGDWRISTS